MSNKYVRLQKDGNTQFVKLLKDRDYYRKFKIPKPLGAEFYIQGDLTDRVGGKKPYGYDTAHSLNGYVEGGEGLCLQKKVDGLILSKAHGNIVGSEIGGWRLMGTSGKTGYTLTEHSPYSFKTTMLSGNTVHTVSTLGFSKLSTENSKVTIRLKYKQTSGTQFGMKPYGAAWYPTGGEKLSHVEIATGEWTDVEVTFDYVNFLGNVLLSFEPSSQGVDFELEVRDLMISYGESIPYKEFTEIEQPTNCKLQYDIPTSIPANNYVVAGTLCGYDINPNDWGFIASFNEAVDSYMAMSLCFAESTVDFPKDKDINFVFIRNDTYHITYIHCEGMIYETQLLSQYGVISRLLFGEYPLGTKMTIGSGGDISSRYINTKLKNYYVGRFNGTEWQDEDGTVNKEYLFKYFMNNGVFEIPPIGEERLIQNSFVKNKEDALFDVYVDTTLEIIE